MAHILVCEIEKKPKISASELKQMHLYDVIRDERDFRILVDGKLFFHEPLFPVLELVQSCQMWAKNTSTNFIYNTIESEENPILSFQKLKEGWNLKSVWQKFECERVYTDSEVISFVKTIVSQVLL